MWLRRAVQRPYGPRRAPRLGGRALGFALATFLLSVAPSQLLAQGQSAGTTRSAKTVLDTRVKANPNSKMLVRANELRYDYQREQISAVGNVQIYYDGAVLEADQVTHDRKANRLSAKGNVRYQTKDGNVIRTDRNRPRCGFPRRLHQFAAGGDRRPHAFRGGARRAQRRECHGARERRVYRVRALQKGSDPAAALAGESGAHHSQRERAKSSTTRTHH